MCTPFQFGSMNFVSMSLEQVIVNIYESHFHLPKALISGKQDNESYMMLI